MHFDVNCARYEDTEKYDVFICQLLPPLSFFDTRLIIHLIANASKILHFVLVVL